ncbi:MAG: PPOX class probable F420-dependent enzyme [Candidatus Azotimanducaceae bacterium]|jgi:PPOX class probable F420-dependent enzyme
MISNNPVWDEFISTHRWAVLTTMRGNGQPSSSVVAYARDEDHLIISTPGTTLKRRTIERNQQVTLCVISNSEPFNFVTIEATAVVETDNLLENTRRVFANIADAGWEEPANLPTWLESQQRVILKISPQRVSAVIR